MNIEDISYSTFMKTLRKKDIKVNGKRISEDITLSIGDKVDVYYTPNKTEKYTTVFKDNNILIINKKSGYASESVFEDIKSQYKNAGFIHRLDRNTSGLMVFSLNAEAENELLKGFRDRTFDKKYHALVKGRMENDKGIINSYLVKDKENSIVKIYDHKVKDSVEIKTGYKVVTKYDKTTLLEVTLFTGKTHQIRAHLAYIGHPICGDGKYGDNNFNRIMGYKTQQLTAFMITFHFEQNSYLSYLDNKSFQINE